MADPCQAEGDTLASLTADLVKAQRMYANDGRSLNKDLDLLEKEVESLDEKVKSLEGDVESLRAKAKSRRERLETLQDMRVSLGNQHLPGIRKLEKSVKAAHAALDRCREDLQESEGAGWPGGR